MNEHNLQDTLDDFKKYIKKMRSYEEAVELMYWDLRTGAPKKGVATRSETIGTLSTEVFKMSVSPQMEEYLQYFAMPEVDAQLDRITRKMVEECKKNYDLSNKIPPQKYQEYVVLTSQSESVWEEAKAASDFSMFQPYLERVVAANLEFIDYWGYEGNKYNTLLDMYEPGMTVHKLDQVFGELRSKLVPLVAAVQGAANKPDTSFLHQHFPKEKQIAFGREILLQLGYDLTAGRLDETVHPFATGLNPGDVRITTKYLEDDMASALFSTIHECGHALYEQNISPELIGTNLCTGTSMGIHESQSRFWENMVGRSRAFWNGHFQALQDAFPGQFTHVTVNEFYRAINEAKPSLIRTESDELTYNLHVMIRYELEKLLFNEQVRVADLPQVWNDKYREYLGVSAASDAEGVLQDVHWSGGAFGYFPSYALGNMYAAQIHNTLRKQFNNFDSLVESGETHPIKEWLTDRIYRHGKLLKPAEIILDVTGEPLNPSYLVEYLENKYNEIYVL